ncbi:unnamed protein product [Auanema sp. JU1783]|nr:unnamed protein product [Auanema sp. JU1783]
MAALITATLLSLLAIANCQWACQNTTWSTPIAQYPTNGNFSIPANFNCSYTITVSNGSVAELNLTAIVHEADHIYVSYGNSSRHEIPQDGSFILSILPPSAVLTVISAVNSTSSNIRASLNLRSYMANVTIKNFGSLQHGAVFNVSASHDTTFVLNADNKVAVHAFPAQKLGSLVSILLYDGNINNQQELKFLGTLYETYMNQKPTISQGQSMTIKCISPDVINYFYAHDSSAITGYSEIKTYISPAAQGSTRQLDFNGLNGSAVAMVLNTSPKHEYYMTKYSLMSKPDDKSALLKVFPVFPSPLINLDLLSLKAYVNNSMNGTDQNTELPQAFMGPLRCFMISNGSAHIELGGDASKDEWQTIGNNRVGILDIEGLASGEKKKWDFQSKTQKRVVLTVNCDNDKDMIVELTHDGNTTTLNKTAATETVMTNFSINTELKNISALGCNVMFSAYDNGYSSSFQILSFILPALIFIFNQYDVLN